MSDAMMGVLFSESLIFSEIVLATWCLLQIHFVGIVALIIIQRLHQLSQFLMGPRWLVFIIY